LSVEYYLDILKQGKEMNIQDAVFRSNEHFKIANLRNHLPFWEHVILRPPS